MSLRNRINQIGSLQASVHTEGYGPIGGANLIGGAVPVTANATTDYQISTRPVRGQFIIGAVTTLTQAASPGTVLVSIAKKRLATTLVMTNTVDLVALAVNTTSALKTLSTLTDAQLAWEVGDITIIRFVSNNGSITIQPAGIAIGFQMAALS